MRYVLVGLGNIGSKRKAILGDRCVATVDPFNPDASHRAPEDCPEGAYDAAVVATPNDVKLDLIRGFLDRGKHVLVEKPLTLTPEVADDLLRRSRRHGAIGGAGAATMSRAPGPGSTVSTSPSGATGAAP